MPRSVFDVNGDAVQGQRVAAGRTRLASNALPEERGAKLSGETLQGKPVVCASSPPVLEKVSVEVP